MLPITFVLQFVLLILPASVYAQSCSTSTTRSCSTLMGMVPNWWPAGTVVRTSIPAVVTLTTTPTVTATTTVPGVPLTATVSTTIIETSTTTAVPSTDTTYLTSTAFATTSVTTTSTTTGVVTTTVLATASALQTSVIPTPTNFIDVVSSSGDSNYAGTRRALMLARENEKRSVLSSWLLALLKASNQGNKGYSSTKRSISLAKFNNPVVVNCVVTLQKYCSSNIKPTTTYVTSTGSATTTTSTIKSTITSTSTVIPPTVTVSVFTSTVTSTLTQVTTVITGATSTLSKTSTTTVTSTTSVYAACGTSNLLGPRLTNGKAISKTYFYDDKAVVVASQQTSAYDCCVACQVSSFCQFFQFSTSSGQCYVTGQDAAWCPNNQQDASWPSYFVYNDPAKVSDALVVGNGICGIAMDLGEDNGQ